MNASQLKPLNASQLQGFLPFIHYENKTSNYPNINITEKKAKSTDTIKDIKTATPIIVFFAIM